MQAIEITRSIAGELDISDGDERFVMLKEEETEENRPAEKEPCREEKIRKVLTSVDFYVTIVSCGTTAIQLLKVCLR